jgi:hypothetical protein
MRGSAPVAGARFGVAEGLYATGALAATLALALTVLGVSPAFGLKQATLLIAGCDLIILAMIVSARRTPPAGHADGEFASLLSAAIADGVMSFAIAAAALIVLFGQSKPIERLGYFFAILVVVPLSVTLAWRRQRAGSTGERRQLLACATLAATAGALCVMRVLALPATATLDTTLFLLIALLAASAALALSARLMPSISPRGLPAKATLVAMPLLLLAAALPFVPPATLGLLDIAIALASGLAAFYLVLIHGDRPGLPRAWSRLLDVGIVLLCALVVFYLGHPVLALAVNQNFFLGPAIDVLHGHPMLVGTFSQYGVGVMDALAALFLVVPIGYGTLTLLVSTLTALLFAVIYVVLRWSTRSQLLAAIGLIVAVSLYVFGQIDFYAYFPSTGVLRFGPPWLVVLCSLAAARTDGHRRLFDGLLFAIVAVAAVWSGEAGVYCLGTACALACLNATVADASARERLRVGARRIASLLAASAGGLLSFTLVTRVTNGAWADWGAYIEYIRLYTTGGLGALPIEPWSPGLALGAMYTVSAIVIVLLALMRPALVRERIVAFRASTGLTVLGVLVFTYYLGRAHPNNLVHISPPAVALLFVWLAIVRSTLDSRLVVAVASGTAIFLGALIVASEHLEIGQKYRHTALAALLGGAPTLPTEVSALWHNPVVEPTAAHVVSFVSSLGDRHSSLTILLTPNVETEALLHLNRANAVGSSNPCQEALSQRSPERAVAGVRSLRPGGILIISVSPSDAGLLLPIQKLTFSLLRARFTLREIATDGRGLFALRMTEPQPPTASGKPRLPTGPPNYGCA